MSAKRLTAVIIAYRKNRLNNRLIFGAPIATVRRGWRRELAIFEPGQIFAYERWRADWYGTQDWRLFVCEAAEPGATTPAPGVIPGADLLLHTKGAVRTKRALAAIEMLKKRTPPLASIPPAHWRRLHNDIESGAFDLDESAIG